jgi:TPP-dependent pyruvate/acetoin dehydrogenase alpha subunit
MDVRLRLYRTMLLIRTVEETIERLHRTSRLYGSFHSSIGQEGCAAGVCCALRPDDLVATTHRGHGHAVAKGVPIAAIFAELFGRATGTSRAKGGSMHLHYRSVGFLGENAIVAGSMPWAAGAAWARRRAGSESIAVSFVGDGGFAQGLFHETIRLAIFWEAPCLFVCENNSLAHSMPVERVVGRPGAIADALRSTGMRSEYVDGRDAAAVHNLALDLVGHVRRGRPAFLECEVYRVRAHSLTDADYRYRPKDSGGAWLQAHDPLARLRNQLREREPDLAAIDADVRESVEQAVATAEEDVAPAVEEAFRDVTANEANHHA